MSPVLIRDPFIEKTIWNSAWHFDRRTISKTYHYYREFWMKEFCNVSPEQGTDSLPYALTQHFCRLQVVDKAQALLNSIDAIAAGILPQQHKYLSQSCSGLEGKVAFKLTHVTLSSFHSITRFNQASFQSFGVFISFNQRI